MAKVSKDGKYLNNIETELSAELHAEFLAIKEQYRAYKAHRQAFETRVQEYLGADNLAVSFDRFGGLSVTVAEAKPKAAPKPQITLAQWLDRQ